MRAALLLLGVATGCIVDPDYSGTRYRCSDGNGCPDGFTCVADLCVSSEPGPDGGGVDAIVPADTLCGELAGDGFDDSSAGPAWTVIEVGATVTEGGGELTIDLPQQVTGTSVGGYQSVPCDLRGSSVHVELLAVPDPARQGAALLRAASGDDHAALLVRQGSLVARLRTGGDDTDVDSLAYDAVMHRWLRLTTSGDTLRWETSPDGSTWTERASQPAPEFLQSVQVLVGGETPRQPSPGSVRFDDFNQ